MNLPDFLKAREQRLMNLATAATWLGDHLAKWYSEWFRGVVPDPDEKALLIRTCDLDAAERWISAGDRRWLGFKLRYTLFTEN